MTQTYIAKLGFKLWSTNVGTQKIDYFTFKTFSVVLVSFEVDDKVENA